MSQKSVTFSTRVSQHKLASWKAGVAGSFNAWVVAALDAQFDLDRAEVRERDQLVAERVAVQAAAFPQGGLEPLVGREKILDTEFFGKKSFRPDPK